MTAWGMKQLLKHFYNALHSRQEAKTALQRIKISRLWQKTTFHFYLSISVFDMYGYGYVTYFHAVCAMVNTWSWNTGTRSGHVQLRSVLGIKAVFMSSFLRSCCSIEVQFGKNILIMCLLFTFLLCSIWVGLATGDAQTHRHTKDRYYK